MNKVNALDEEKDILGQMLNWSKFPFHVHTDIMFTSLKMETSSGVLKKSNAYIHTVATNS